MDSFDEKWLDRELAGSSFADERLGQRFRKLVDQLEGAMGEVRAAERWRAIKVTDFERRQMAAVRKELDHEYEAQSGLAKQPSKGLAADKLSSSSQT